MEISVDTPMKEINTTPLIDVMLVLLIMFILVIPAITHKIPIDLPVASATESRTPPTIRQLDIAQSGALYWDGARISEQQLAGRLETMAADPSRYVLQVNTDGSALYDDVSRHLATIARSGVEQLGFVGNREFAAALG